MKRDRVVVERRDDTGRLSRQEVIVLDVFAQHGIEYLVFEDAGGDRHQVRLDDILGCDFGGS